MNAILSSIDATDVRLASRVRAWMPPRWFCLWMVAATRFGDGWGWLVAAALLAWRDPAVLVAGCTASAVATTVFVVLKQCLRRPRPHQGLRHVLFEVHAPDRFSFPSGHTLNAFAISTVLALRFPATAPLLGVLACSIGASRVVLGLHYLSDVLAAAVLGILVGAAAGR